MKMEFLNSIKNESANFILKDYLPIPQYAVTLLSASGGVGKTRLSLIMADKFIQKENKNVALWLTEDYPGQVRAIFDEMIKDNLVTPSSMASMIIILEEPPQLALRVNGLFKANYEEIKKLGEHLVKNNVHFAVFDPLLAFYGGNENDNSEARVFIQSFAEWAKVAKITTLIIHHANKDGASRGATAFHDGVRARYELAVPTDDDGNPKKDLVAKGIRLATLKKDNWGIRKYLWALTDGEDSILLKIAPELRNEYKRIEPEITTYEYEEEPKTDDNDYLGSMF